ncbi:hypothetical protein D043_1061B, partial [Vibrio parahaemolyticus EKP-021]
IQFITN